MKAKTSTIMFVCIDVGEYGCKKFWLLFFVWQIPAKRLTKLKMELNILLKVKKNKVAEPDVDETTPAGIRVVNYIGLFGIDFL